MKAVYTILIAVFCAFVAQKGMAESSAYTIIEGSGSPECETLLAGLKPTFSQFDLSRYFFRDYPPVRTLKPSSGVGLLLVVDLNVVFRQTELVEMARIYPEFFKKFDIYTNGKQLIIPNAERLNSLMTNGIHFADVPFWRKQSYPDEYFVAKFGKGIIPLASFGFFFGHDRLFEHLIGSMIMPSWLYKKAVRSFELEKELFSEENRSTDPALEIFYQFYRQHWRTVGYRWDNMTSYLGNAIQFLRYKTSDGQVSKEALSRLKAQLFGFSKGLTPGRGSQLEEALLDTWHGTDDEKQRIHRLIVSLRYKYDSLSVTQEFADLEASRIIREIMGHKE